MSINRHLSIGKIRHAPKALLARVLGLNRDLQIYLIGLNLIGLVGSLTTYPGAILVTLAVSLYLILYPPIDQG
jgi:hypothetical protein